MAGTTYPHFGANTEGHEVTESFKDVVVGKTIMVTGVNKGGIGFSTTHALVCLAKYLLLLQRLPD